MNQSSSPITARKNTLLVVKRGRIGTITPGLPATQRESEKQSGEGAKRERVPVPVLEFGISKLFGHKGLVDLFLYVPVWTMLTVGKDVAYEI